MKLPPDQTAELRAGELVVVRRDHGPEVLLDDVGVFAQRGIHVAEEDAKLFQVLTVAVVHRFRVVHGAHAGEVLPLRLGDTQLLVRLLDRLGDHVPVLGLSAFGLDVVVDVVEVDVVEQATPTPRWNGAPEEPLVGLEPEIEHPLRLALHPRHVSDHVLAEALLRLEGVIVLVVPTQLVGAEIDVDGRHIRPTPSVRFPLSP